MFSKLIMRLSLFLLFSSSTLASTIWVLILVNVIIGSACTCGGGGDVLFV
jgi:hypothetical protein